MRRPNGSTEKDGKVYNHAGLLIEEFEGQWRVVKNSDRSGWWCFCDNRGRGYLSERVE